MNYPKMKQQNFSYTMANHTVEDKYILLEQPKLPETLNWVRQQNEFTDAYFTTHLNKTVKDLIQHYSSQQKPAEYTGFIPANKGIAATRHNADGTYTLVWLNDDLSEREEVQLPLEESFTVFSMVPSGADNDLVYCRALKDGADRPNVLIYDLNKNKLIQQLDGIFYSIWDQSGTKVIYSDAEVDKERGCNLNFIRIFDCIDETTRTLYSTDENAVLIQIASSHDGSTIMGSIMKDYANVIHVSLDAKTEKVMVMNPIAKPIHYCDTVQGKHFFISYENAPYGQVVSVDSGKTFEDSQIVLASSDIIIQDMVVDQNRLLLLYMKDAHNGMRIIDLEAHTTQECQMPSEFGTLSFLNGNLTMKHNVDKLYLGFESFTVAPMILTLKGDEIIPVLSNSAQDHSADEIEVIQKKVIVRDGTAVPCFIVHQKKVPMNGSNPTLMYAYGGYNNAMLPMYENPFVGLKISDWVKDGGIYVHLNIRGGNEYGTRWHKEGMLNQKKNCFYDFIDITEALIQEGWTSPEKIGICGGSNGGLLMCALLTMRPDLWRCVIASVPHTDMLRFCLDDRGPMYITEYGNPQEETMFDYMKSYSPYHNVKAVDYPAILIQTGECDNNVPPYHGKKMAARLQECNTSIYPILLRVLEKGSHDRGKKEVYYQTISEMQAFLKYHLMK